jgi:hypothetical protein
MAVALIDPASARAVVAGSAAALAPKAMAYSPRWFIRRQIANAERYLAGLPPLAEDEFESHAASPSAAHIRAVNALLGELRASLEEDVQRLRKRGQEVLSSGMPRSYEAFLRLKDKVNARTHEGERLLAFYRNMFDQRRGRFGHQLLPIDRIARDCYQAVWLGLGQARSIPAPPPFSYVEDGQGPATFRRGVKLSMLGKRPNPFPLVKVPQHRLQNPWTLGAVPHEVAHNLQNDLGLWGVVPKRIEQAMTDKLPEAAVDTWIRLHKETYADFAGLLLIGPAYVESLIDVVAKRGEATAAFNPDGVHPTPLIRVPMNCRLLRRIGFEAEADAFEKTWSRIYPPALRDALPEEFRVSFDLGCDLAVQAICFQPEDAYGGRALADVVKFSAKDVIMVREAGARLLRGENTGILPERLLISAARIAFRSEPARAAEITRNFYLTLGRA